MKVLIFLAAWRRPEITEICFMGINRLRQYGLFPIDTMCVISEDSMIPLCEKYGIDYVMHRNDYLGEKKNACLNAAMLKSWDYLIEIGSDDLLKNEILDKYKPFMERGEDLFGIKDFIYINSEDGNCRRYKSDTTYGAARCISRKIIEKLCYGYDVLAKVGLIVLGNTISEGKKGFLRSDIALENEKLGRVEILGPPRYRLWKDDINKGLDNNSNFYLMTNFVSHKKVETENALGIDIKSRVNIWGFNPIIGVPHPLAEAMEGLSDEEKTALLGLIKKEPIETAVYR